MATQTYAYKVRDRQGAVVEGTLEAESTSLVADKLRQMGYVPVTIESQTGSGLQREVKIPGLGPRVKLKDVAVFSRQFSTMINSGLSLLRSLYILADQTESPALREIIGQVRQDLEKGASLSQALGRHPKAFSRLYVAMVRAGETGGVLDTVLQRLADTIEKQVELRRKIKSALTYPVAVFALVLLIVTAMLLFIVPMFEDMYDQLGGTLPLPTRILMGASELLRRFFIFVFLGEAVGVFAFKRWIQSESGRARWDAIKLRMPVFGKLIHKTALARFSRSLSVLLRSGVPILEALEITSETVSNHVMATAVKNTQAAVKAGEAIHRPLGEHDVFPPMVVQMIAVGEETGAVDEMLDKVGAFYEQEVEATVAQLTSLLEPALIVVMGGAVGAMVVALYLPMFNIINLIQ